MGQASNRSAEYFFTGNYFGDDDDNEIDAIGFGGNIYARGGDDYITLGSIAANVHTGSGDDTVVGGSAYLHINDPSGHLTVKGAVGYIDIDKSDNGNTLFAGAAGGAAISHIGGQGNVKYNGAALYNKIFRKGQSGNVTFEGAGGYNSLWHETNQGDLSFVGAGGANKLDRTWLDKYQGSRGNVTFEGAGAANIISSRVQTGNITFKGAGAYNQIIRKGASGGLDDEGIAYANADEVVLSHAVLRSDTRFRENNRYQVTGIKSNREVNTYLFACVDNNRTFIIKVKLSNHPKTNQLMFSSTDWYKIGNHLSGLADQDITAGNGFKMRPSVHRNSKFIKLNNVRVEHQKIAANRDIEQTAFTSSQWREYGNKTSIDANDVELLNANMNMHSLSGVLASSANVNAVKSNRQPNTYLFASATHSYVSIMVVQLRNDPKTKALQYQICQKFLTGGGSQLNRKLDLANEDVSGNNGYYPLDNQTLTLSDINYRTITARHIATTHVDLNKKAGALINSTSTNNTHHSSGDINFNGAGGGNVIKSYVTQGDIFFDGGGIANVIEHRSKIGNTEFNGGGAANVIVKSGDMGNLIFRGGGITNVLVHQSQIGEMDVNAGGVANVLVRIGEGLYRAELLALGNISVHKGNGQSQMTMKGGLNTHTQIGSGNGLWLATGGFNVMTQVGQGDISSVFTGGANVLSKIGNGHVITAMIGGGNIITHITDDEEQSDTTVIALGGANILTKKGQGRAVALMGGLANVFTHVGDGNTKGIMVGAGNVLTKVGHGDTIGAMLGIGNVLTHVGNGRTLSVMGAIGNIFTKVGDGTSIAAMVAAGNLFTQVGNGDTWALMGGAGNVFTKVGDGDSLALMVAKGNVFTQIGNGTSVALMLAKGNLATKVGNGLTLSAMVGAGNVFTHLGNGSTFAAMIGKVNIMTKVGDDLTFALMIGNANIYTHVGHGTSIGLFAGQMNVMTKVGNGTTLAAMFGKANIMTHVGNGLTGVLALGEANVVTKVGDDFMGVIAAAKANVITHVGNATTAAILKGKGNILTKVGDGTTVGLLISDVGNIMTHLGHGMTIGIAKGKANIITKVGDGLNINATWGDANIFTQIGDGDRYNFAKGNANIITKVGHGQEVSIVHGKANIITHVGDGDDYTGAWGQANIITKVGNGRNVICAKGDANIATKIGSGDSFNGIWGKANVVTKVGDGMHITMAKGKVNIITTVGNGLNITATYGDANINTKVGNGTSINVAWGKYNVNTQVGDGLNVAVMKGKANANIKIGNGLVINASYARNNVVIKIGNGDFYSLAIASSNTDSHKLSTLFGKIKQTILGTTGSKAINYLVQGDEASSSGTRNGHGVIKTPEITKLTGFNINPINEMGSNLNKDLSGNITSVELPDLDKIKDQLNVEQPLQTNVVSQHANLNTSTENALSDKEQAEANRQRLEQEKEQQLAAIAGTQKELESTDQEALKTNGLAQREEMQKEAEIETEKLTKLAKDLDTLSAPTEDNGNSNPIFGEYFAGGIVDNTQTQLNASKNISVEQLTAAQQNFINNQENIQAAVTQSESSVAKGEQNQTNAEQDINKAETEVEVRKSQAQAKKIEAEQSQSKASNAVNEAQTRADRDAKAAKEKVNQAQVDANGSKQNENDHPDRQSANGSGLSGKAYTVEGAGETESYVNTDGHIDADGGFSQGLTDQELDGLNSGIQAINRLQINAGIRANHTSSSIMSKYSQSNTDNVSTTNSPLNEIIQSSPKISGVNLDGIEQISRGTVVARSNLLINFGYKVFDMQAGGKELKNSSFHFNQNNEVLNPLSDLMREIGNVRITNGDDVEARTFREGICFGLSARYMMEERVHGSGGGKAYMEWLKNIVDSYTSPSVIKNNNIDSIKQKLLNDFRRQHTSVVIEDLLSIQHSQAMDSHSQAAREAAEMQYGGKLRANGLTGPNINNALNYASDGYESVMGKLRNVKKSTYMTFMSKAHAMSVVVHVQGNQKNWSFYDPNFGAKSFSRYDDFQAFMNKFHKSLLTKYQFQASEEPNQSFYVSFNKFEDAEIADYNNQWKNAQNNEQSYVLRALKEQKIHFIFGKDLTGKITDFQENTVTLEVTTKAGRKVSIEVASDNIDHATQSIQTNIRQLLSNPFAHKLSLQVNEESDSVRVRILEANTAHDQNITNVDERFYSLDDDVHHRNNVNEWENIIVTSQTRRSEMSYDGQMIIQLQNDPDVVLSTTNLANKHPENSIVVQLDSDGNYRVVHGDLSKLSGYIRWQVVGHGGDKSEDNNMRLSGYRADELAVKLAKFNQDINKAKNINATPEYISLVGCSLVSDDMQQGFGKRFITAMNENGIRTEVSARNKSVAVNNQGRKHTFDSNGQWIHKNRENKVVFSWNSKGEIISDTEEIRYGIAEGDINVSRIGSSEKDILISGALGNNNEKFTAPEKRRNQQEVPTTEQMDHKLSYSGNIQVDVGDGEFTTLNWGTSNLGIKVGSGGFKSLVFGDNNIMIHIGNGDSKHSVDIAGYQALEGAQLFIGNRNISFNMGRSNDLIVMMEKSIITPPLVNPFDGASRISRVLQTIARFGEGQNWLLAQNQQWTLAGAKKFVKEMSGLDQTSSVDYNTLVDLDSKNERSGRGLKYDIEASLNKKYNQWLGENKHSEIGQATRTEKLRNLNQDAVFNFAVGGQGADIIVTTSNWNFVFGDNIQSLLDTDLGSLFGLMTQQTSKSGLLVTTFTYNPADLPRQLQNRLLGRMASVDANTTLGDIFGVDYTSDGRIVSRNGEPVDSEAILKGMIEIVGQFGDEQLRIFTDPDKFLDKLKAGLDMGADGIKSFAESHGLKQRDLDPEESEDTPVSQETSTIPNESPTQNRPLGFNSLNLPNIFATIFNKEKQTEMRMMMENIKENLTVDLMNMQDTTFDFLRNSGHLQGHGDMHVSLGNYNFNWGGDGKDLGAYLGDNNNFWGGRGDDVYYAMGTSNIFSGGQGNDTGVLMGRENWMFGGDGNDTAVIAGRVNHVYLGNGDDQSFVFGEGGEIDTGTGHDYTVISGNFNRLDTGEGQDYSVIIGNNNQVELNEGHDFANIFGNENTVRGGIGNDGVKLMGFHSTLNGEYGNDHLIAKNISKFSVLDGGEGNDLLVLGGYKNTFRGGNGVDSFVVNSNIIDNIVEDVSSEDNIVFDNVSWSNLWLEKNGSDLKIALLRDTEANTDQAKFEKIGLVTFSHYFDGNRAKIVISMEEKDDEGKCNYSALSDNAIDNLVLAMSSIEPEIGSDGFMDKLDENTRYAVTTAWSDVIHGKGLVA